MEFLPLPQSSPSPHPESSQPDSLGGLALLCFAGRLWTVVLFVDPMPPQSSAPHPESSTSHPDSLVSPLLWLDVPPEGAGLDRELDELDLGFDVIGFWDFCC